MISWWEQLKHVLDERDIRWRWHNRNEGPRGEPKGPPWEGYAVLHLTERFSLRAEWNALARFVHAYVKGDPADDEVCLSLGLGPTVWLHAEGKPVRWLLERVGLTSWRGRELGVHAYDGRLSWRLWADPDCWESSRPRWRDGTFDVVAFLLGRPEHRVVSDELHQVVIPLPEGSYPANVVMRLEEWKRPRWFARRITRAHVELETPIPFSGKGENSWDCGTDGLSASTFPARTLGEAVGHVVESVFQTRARRGDPWCWPKEALPEVSP